MCSLEKELSSASCGNGFIIAIAAAYVQSRNNSQEIRLPRGQRFYLAERVDIIILHPYS